MKFACLLCGFAPLALAATVGVAGTADLPSNATSYGWHGGAHTWGTAAKVASGHMEAAVKANVRVKPTAASKITAVLRKGARIEVLAVVPSSRDPDKRWCLISRHGKVIGFIYQPLVRRVADPGHWSR